VSDRPENHKPDQNGPEDAEQRPPEPEQIWPPPEGAPDADKLNWASEVGKINDAIDEIRRINSHLGTPERTPRGEGESESAPQQPAEQASAPGASDEQPSRRDPSDEQFDLASAGEAEEIPEAIEASDFDEPFEIEEAVGLPEPREEESRREPTPADELVGLDDGTPMETEPEETFDLGGEPAPSWAPEQAEASTMRDVDVRSHVRRQSESELGRLWANVFFSAEAPPPRGLLVVASKRGDGATQIASSLGLIGAEANRELRIALVDFNLRDPGIAGALGIAAEPGLADVLAGNARLDEAMQTLRLRNGASLNVLTAGKPPGSPLGLLKSRQVKALIAELLECFDHTIFDMASPNMHPDAQVLGSMLDGALVVARAGETPRETVAEAKKRLELAGVRCLGLVLNQRSDPVPGFLYHNV